MLIVDSESWRLQHSTIFFGISTARYVSEAEVALAATPLPW